MRGEPSAEAWASRIMGRVCRLGAGDRAPARPICRTVRGREGKVRCFGVEEIAGIHSQHAGVSSSTAPSNGAPGGPPISCAGNTKYARNEYFVSEYGPRVSAPPPTAAMSPAPSGPPTWLGRRRSTRSGGSATSGVRPAGSPSAFPTASCATWGGGWSSSSTAQEIEANNWSLTPVRYVGVATENEDFDFATVLREIHAELAELDAESAVLAPGIQKYFEELGI